MKRGGPSLVPIRGAQKHLVNTCMHRGLKGSLLEVGGCYRPQISAGGCEHPTRTPLQQLSVLSSLRESTQPLPAWGSERGWGCPVSPESFNLLPGG